MYNKTAQKVVETLNEPLDFIKNGLIKTIIAKMVKKNVITVETLKMHLSYCPYSGIFHRIEKSANCVKIGEVAGSLRRGYIVISINKKQYPAHRLAWLYMTGEMPVEFIDHINGIRNDNRFCNLREATNGQNMQNKTKPHSNNKVGVLGVGQHPKTGKWIARITIDKKVKSLGSYLSMEDAIEARLKGKEKYHTFSSKIV